MSGPLVLCPLVFAMGLQNATAHRADGISIGVTYMTGTLVQIGRTLASVLRGENASRDLTQYTALWFSLAVGAALGALVLTVSPSVALSFAAAVAAILAFVTSPRCPLR